MDEQENTPLSDIETISEIIKRLRGQDGRASSREFAHAITKLQEAQFWLGEGIVGLKKEE